METKSHSLTPEDRQALEEVSRSEAEVLHAYTIFLPQLDTPELRDKLKVQVDRHHLISRKTDALLSTPSRASAQEEVAMPVVTSPLGDTLDTLKALESINEAERLSRERIEAAFDTGVSQWLKAQLKSWLEDLEIQRSELNKVLTSVRAAAQLWGPASEIPVLHH